MTPPPTIKMQCTGNDTHKPAYLGRLQLPKDADGKVHTFMQEAFDSSNEHNGRGVTDAYRKNMPAVYSQSVPEDLKPVAGDLPQSRFYDGPLTWENVAYLDGVSGHSFRFKCDRCKRDFQIDQIKLAQAALALIDNGYKYFDLSKLPFG